MTEKELTKIFKKGLSTEQVDQKVVKKLLQKETAKYFEKHGLGEIATKSKRDEHVIIVTIKDAEPVIYCFNESCEKAIKKWKENEDTFFKTLKKVDKVFAEFLKEATDARSKEMQETEYGMD